MNLSPLAQQQPEETDISLFMTAVIDGDAVRIKGFLERFFGLANTANPENGITALCYAAGDGRDDIVEILLEAGADVDLPSFGVLAGDTPWADGATPLMKAVEFGRVSTAILLFGAGAKVDRQSRSGYTALMVSVERFNPEMSALVLSYKPNTALTNNKGHSALDLARIAAEARLQFAAQLGGDIGRVEKERAAEGVSDISLGKLRVKSIKPGSVFGKKNKPPKL